LRNQQKREQGWSGPLKAAVTSGSLCSVGDVLAQSIAGWYASPNGEDQARAAAAAGTKAGRGAPAAGQKPYDPRRTLRMAGFGLLFYGPYQYYWYSLLEHLAPARTAANFVAKVAANQLLLAPVTLTVAFAWHLAFSGQAGQAQAASGAAATAAAAPAPPPVRAGRAGRKRQQRPAGDAGAPAEAGAPGSGGGGSKTATGLAARLAPLPAKLRADFAPALLDGWKFWVPAASVNFCYVPLRRQVLYMSCCGVLWTAYLSHVSGTGSGGRVGAAAAPAAKRA